MKIRTYFAGIILLIGAACQPTLVTDIPIPTLMMLPTNAPTQRPSPTFTLEVSATSTPTVTPSTTITSTPPPSHTPLPTPTLTPTLRSSLPQAFAYGKSVEGRDLLARTFGVGQKMLILVGGIHTGYEANTVDLVNEMIAHFERNPQDVLPGMTLVLIPVANPDGLERGRNANGRFNANNVDLNRNWDCDWSTDAVWLNRQVDPGSEPFSEPESIALAALIYDLRPDTVLFYHANARGVFPGNCPNSDISGEMAQVLGEASGYPYEEQFEHYEVTGTEASWVDSLGIPAADVELTTTTATDFTQNYNGVMAVQRWILGG